MERLSQLASSIWTWTTGKPKPMISRKYADLIFAASSLWGMYSPFQAEQIQPGDFGFIERETGMFRRKGNIYTEPSILEQAPELKQAEYQPKEGQPVNKMVFTSTNARHIEKSATANVAAVGSIEASIDVEVSFGKERGAFLIMHKPQTVELPSDVLNVLEHVNEIKQGKDCVVTKVIRCPAYVLQVSDKGATTTRVRFICNLPVAYAPGVTAGAGGGIGWRSERVGTSYQEAFNEEGECVYSTLLGLKRPGMHEGPSFRQVGGRKTGEKMWMDVVPPWNPLDDDGNELPNEDD